MVCESNVASCYFLLHRKMQEYGRSALDTGKYFLIKGSKQDS